MRLHRLNRMSPTPIYLDHQASTPLDPRVAAVMERYVGCYGNPHTTSHRAGIDAGKAVNVARRQVARAIGGDARRVVFTSGATEANNLAILGAARANCDRSESGHGGDRTQFSARAGLGAYEMKASRWTLYRCSGTADCGSRGA